MNESLDMLTRLASFLTFVKTEYMNYCSLDTVNNGFTYSSDYGEWKGFIYTYSKRPSSLNPGKIIIEEVVTLDGKIIYTRRNDLPTQVLDSEES